MTSVGRERVIDALALTTVKLLLGAWVLHAGFTHVSDDDYARTVIAEQLARAPRLDPSGTSWLPAPFWVEGAAMALAGRTLGVARGVAVALGAASVAAPYLALRAASVHRAPAFAATLVAMALPWDLWLGVATVPEAWVSALVAAAAIGAGVRALTPWVAGALLVASLSRYEAWPACAVIAVAWAARWARDEVRSRWDLAWITLACAGPLAWLAWNLHAHGSALHFVARVTTFRQSTGASTMSWREKLLVVPQNLVSGSPCAAALGAVGIASLRSPAVRARWSLPAAVALGVVAFLVAGEAADGAPTHHPGRALLGVWWILVAMGTDAAWGIERLGARARLAVQALLAVLGVAVGVASSHDAPGASPDEDREPQIARGLDLRARHVGSIDVSPCSFEHFALLAAWGRPESARVARSTGATPTTDCPGVVEHATEDP